VAGPLGDQDLVLATNTAAILLFDVGGLTIAHRRGSPRFQARKTRLSSPIARKFPTSLHSAIVPARHVAIARCAVRMAHALDKCHLFAGAAKF